MKSTLIRLGLLAVMISALAGCGGASDGAPGAPGAPGTDGTSGNVVTATSLTADQWLVLKPTIDPASISVTINSPPVVKFKVTDDQYGNPLVGLGGQVQGHHQRSSKQTITSSLRWPSWCPSPAAPACGVATW